MIAYVLLNNFQSAVCGTSEAFVTKADIFN